MSVKNNTRVGECSVSSKTGIDESHEISILERPNSIPNVLRNWPREKSLNVLPQAIRRSKHTLLHRLLGTV